MKQHLQNTELRPVLVVCARVDNFRRWMVKMRGTLISPGYHEDIDQASVALTRKFLAELPAKTVLLASQIHYLGRTEALHFKIVINTLNQLRQNPRSLFEMKATELNARLIVQVQLPKVIKVEKVTSEAKEAQL